MKKFSIILLILTISFNSLGYYVLYTYLKNQVKKEIKSQIKRGVPTEGLIAITFSEKNSHEFKWLNKKEFLYRNVMYDIVRSEKLNDGQQVFFCVNDKQETELFRSLRKIVNESVNGNPSNRSAVIMLYLYLGGLFLEEDDTYNPSFTSMKISFGCVLAAYNMPSLSKLAPPPKIIFFN